VYEALHAGPFPHERNCDARAVLTDQAGEGKALAGLRERGKTEKWVNGEEGRQGKKKICEKIDLLHQSNALLPH